MQLSPFLLGESQTLLPVNGCVKGLLTFMFGSEKRVSARRRDAESEVRVQGTCSYGAGRKRLLRNGTVLQLPCRDSPGCGCCCRLSAALLCNRRLVPVPGAVVPAAGNYQRRELLAGMVNLDGVVKFAKNKTEGIRHGPSLAGRCARQAELALAEAAVSPAALCPPPALRLCTAAGKSTVQNKLPRPC